MRKSRTQARSNAECVKVKEKNKANLELFGYLFSGSLSIRQGGMEITGM